MSGAQREPTRLHERAEKDLQHIRDIMDGASSFTALPGWGGVLIGSTALVTAWIAHGRSTSEWFYIWVGEAVVAVAIGVLAIRVQAARNRIAMIEATVRRVVMGLGASVLAGAIISIAMYRAGTGELVPGVWLTLYGSGVLAASIFSIRLIQVMGVCFMALGAVTMAAPVAWGNAMLAIGFGGLHIVFGLILMRRYRG